MKPQAVIDLVKDQLWPIWENEKTRLNRIDLWYRWDAERVSLARTATAEQKYLADLGRTPWLSLGVTNVAQALFVDGYRSPSAESVEAAWATWVANDMPSRQVAIHRAALAYGIAYATALPGVDDDGPRAVFRGVSPRKMIAFYADPAEDDWPMFAMRVIDQPGGKVALRVFDEDNVYYLSADNTGASVIYIEDRAHRVGVCPVVRYANMLDLDGRTPGEVEPFISVAQRVNKTAFDRLLTQHFNSWKVRTVTGMDKPETPADEQRSAVLLRQSELLVAEDKDARFGTLDETSLDGFISAYDSDVNTLAALLQMPAALFGGNMVNLSAEALALAEAPMQRKVGERKTAFGKSHDQLIRLGAAIDGDSAAALDTASHVTWQDVESRSLAQAADAYGKIATMLGVPVEALWSRLPGVTKDDVTEWKKLAEDNDAVQQLINQLDAANAPQAPAV